MGLYTVLLSCYPSFCKYKDNLPNYPKDIIYAIPGQNHVADDYMVTDINKDVTSVNIYCIKMALGYTLFFGMKNDPHINSSCDIDIAYHLNVYVRSSKVITKGKLSRHWKEA